MRLFGSPKLHGRYRDDPAQLMKAAGLTPKERALLLSGDEQAIRAYLGDGAGAVNVIKDGLVNVIKEGMVNVIKDATAPAKKPTKPKK